MQIKRKSESSRVRTHTSKSATQAFVIFFLQSLVDEITPTQREHTTAHPPQGASLHEERQERSPEAAFSSPLLHQPHCNIHSLSWMGLFSSCTEVFTSTFTVDQKRWSSLEKGQGLLCPSIFFSFFTPVPWEAVLILCPLLWTWNSHALSVNFIANTKKSVFIILWSYEYHYLQKPGNIILWILWYW